MKWIEAKHPELSLRRQCELASVSYASLYYQPSATSEREVAIKRRLDEVYTAHPYYGSRKIAVVLASEFGVSRPTVQAYMREMGLHALVPPANTSKRAPQHPVYPYLLRNVTARMPKHIWGIDITYIRLQRSWLYLVAILDWHSRYVVSWELSQTLEIDFVIHALERALRLATPTICNSDQGSHFTSPQYIDRLRNANVQISMDGRGRAVDNIFTERLWRTLKYEEVYLVDYASPKEARQRLDAYFNFYNFQRPHQALDYRTPAQCYNAAPMPAVVV